MILYHTSMTEIPVPDIRRGRKNADFGQGFYLTPDEDFSYRWAWKDAVVNRYELDLTGLRVKTFSRSEEWFEYIFLNRRAKDTIDADVVIGPIANDTIFETFGIITSGFLQKEQALKLLMIGPVYQQTVIKTEKAAAALRFLGAAELPEAEIDAFRETVRQEELRFQEEFAAVMESITGN